MHSLLIALIGLLTVPVLSREQVVLKEDDELQPPADCNYSLVQPIYEPFALGDIKPDGWFKSQLELEADGLAGNMFDFYRFVRDSRWIGGSTEYSPLDEASPYWFNGLVPLAFSTDDERLKSQVKYYLDYVIDHQHSDGWLGFEDTRQTRGLWARCLLLLGMIQYAEADPAETKRIVDSMHRYVGLAHSMLKDNYTGLLVHDDDVFDIAGFGVGRTHEMHIPLQWLLEKYPRNNSQIIWETMELMIDGGVVWGADWREFWVPGVFPEVYYEETSTFNLSWVFVHGVNMAQGLRYPLAVHRMTREEDLRTQTRTAVDLLAAFHKSVAGSIVADELISDLNPSRGSELCISAEIMFSMAYIYQYLADNDLADWVEQAAFNAFPTTMSGDWWSHQYIQQENQPWARNLTQGDGLWTDVGSYSNVFGLEPNYPCCTVNFPQAYPKFLVNSFVKTTDGGVAHVFLVPAHLETLIGDNEVSISVVTNYPFAMDLAYNASATSAIPFYVRIPTWATGESSIEGPGDAPARKVSPSEKGLQRVDIPAGGSGAGTTFTLHLAAEPRVEYRPNNTVAIHYGALLYSLAIEYEETAHAPLAYRYETILPDNTTDERSCDYAMVPRAGTVWNIAVDPSQIKVVVRPGAGGSGKSSGGGSSGGADELPSSIWELGAPPVELRVAAVEIEWPLAYDTPADPPADPRPVGRPFSARFVPYGSTKLHMSHLPVVSLPKVQLTE